MRLQRFGWKGRLRDRVAWPAAAMRFLLFSWQSVLRRYVDMVVELGEAGHEVVIAYPSQKPRKLPPALRERAGVSPVSYDEVSDPAFGRAIALLRQTRDYAWYLSPRQRVASFNRRHALGRLVRVATAGRLGADPSWPDPVMELAPGDL